MSQEMQSEWTFEQDKYLDFLAANQTDTTGKKWTREEFAKNVLHVDPATLWRWQKLPGFKQELFERTLGRTVSYIPQMVNAMVLKTVKQRDVPAFMALMRQYELLKSDKIDHTTNGKELPTPIYGGSSVGANDRS